MDVCLGQVKAHALRILPNFLSFNYKLFSYSPHFAYLCIV
jgi:hypothetical protein